MTTTAQTEGALLAALKTIRTYWPALMLATTGGSLGPASSDEVTPLDRRISLRHEVTLTLNGWARLIVDDRDLTHGLPLGTDTIGLCELIERHATWFSGHEAAPDALAEIGGAAEQVKGAAVPQRRDWMPLGACPLDMDSEAGPVTCGGQVRAYPGREPQCQKCGTDGVMAWWERVMFPDVETSDLLLEAEIATFVHRAFGGSPIKPSTIRQWVRREVITSAGKDDKGRSLYSRKAVVEALSERAEASS